MRGEVDSNRILLPPSQKGDRKNSFSLYFRQRWQSSLSLILFFVLSCIVGIPTIPPAMKAEALLSVSSLQGQSSLDLASNNEFQHPLRILQQVSQAALLVKPVSLQTSEEGFPRQLQLHLIQSLSPNAYLSDNQSIHISSGLLKMIDSNDQLAFIFAHEIGHLYLGHLHDRPQLRDSDFQDHALHQELAADDFALHLLSANSLHRENIKILLLKLAHFGDKYGGSLSNSLTILRARIAAVGSFPNSPTKISQREPSGESKKVLFP